MVLHGREELAAGRPANELRPGGTAGMTMQLVVGATPDNDRAIVDRIAGLYAGAHADLEIPCGGACIFYTGVRAEWDYTWMDILQRSSDIMGINALATFGVRW